jgi:hypothetical protein
MTNFVPEVVGNDPLAAAVVVTALEVVIVLEVVTGGLVIAVVEADETGAFDVDVLMVVGTLEAAPGTHCEYQSLPLSQ